MTFVTATQPLKDLLYQVYEQLPVLIASGRYRHKWEAIYFNFYAPVDRRSLVKLDRQGWIWWERHDLRAARQLPDANAEGQLLALIQERIYLNLLPERVESIWNLLQSEFEAEREIMEAKHCSLIAALGRYDTVVIYLTSNQATHRFLQRLRDMRMHGRLQTSDFRNQTPPGTGQVADLPGVAVAAETPAGGHESFGTRLCKVVAETWKKSHRKGANKWDFVGDALRDLVGEHIDVRRPWQVRL